VSTATIPRGRYRRADVTKLASVGRPVVNLDRAYDLMLAEAHTWGVTSEYAQLVTAKAWDRLRKQRS